MTFEGIHVHPFLLPNIPPPSVCSPQPHTRWSLPHKVKGYADDLTVISSNPQDHQEVFTSINNRCNEICLTIRPDKFFSVVFDGRRFSLKVVGGHTNRLKATTFLGSTIGYNSWTSQKIASKEILALFSSSLTHLDCAPIRGEYKIWIYRRYLVPSLHYKLAVNAVAKTTINKMNATATKYIKRWLGLTRST